MSDKDGPAHTPGGQAHKTHNKAHSGRKADRKAEKDGKGKHDLGFNPKAFSVQRPQKIRKRFPHKQVRTASPLRRQAFFSYECAVM